MILIDLNISEQAFEEKMERLKSDRGILILQSGTKTKYVLFQTKKRFKRIRSVTNWKDITWDKMDLFDMYSNLYIHYFKKNWEDDNDE